MKLTLEIPHTPSAQKRPRFVKSTGRAYSPNVTEEGKALLFIYEQMKGQRKLEGALSAKFEFVFVRPKSHYGTGRNTGVLKPSSPNFCTITKDVSNLVKFIEDTMNNQVFADDRQIVKYKAEKRYGSRERTIVELEELEDIG